MEIKIALAGNPNCGKTTLFNALTGSNQFVGNWPGVTVEKKEGKLKGHKDVVIMDLPGIYSLSPYTLEEVVARNYLISERPDAILNIIDGTNLERNLYLTTQLVELGIPVVVAINMMDVVKKNGDKINTDQLAKELGCQVCEISALKGTGIKEAAELAVKAAESKVPMVPQHSFNGVVEHAIAHIEEAFLNDVAEEQQRWYAIKIFERDEKVIEQLGMSEQVKTHIEKDICAAEKEMDDDSESIITNERYIYIASIIKDCYKKKNQGGLTTSDKIDKIVTNRWLGLPIFAVVMFLVYYISMVTVGSAATDWANDGLFGDGWHLFGIGSSDAEDAADEYGSSLDIINAFIEQQGGEAIDNEADDFDVDAAKATADNLLATVDKSATADYTVEDEETLEETTKTAKYADLKAAVAAAEKYSFADPDPADYGVWVPGIPVLIESGLDAVNCADWLKGLILDGIVAGVGAVLGFVPQMLVLFILLAILEACGYMARIAFVMDRIFRKFGLSGKSFIPFLIGSGCGVPGIMATRTIENEKDRRMTMMTVTNIPCGAKLPVIALIAGFIMGDGCWWMAPLMYFAGIGLTIIYCIILKKTRAFAGEPAPFVMELPQYHIPSVKGVLLHVWERVWAFIKKAGTILFLCCAVMWFLSSFGIQDGAFGLVDKENSLLAVIGSAIAVIFAPLGFDTWQAVASSLSGFVAKEGIVSTMGVLSGLGEVEEYAVSMHDQFAAFFPTTMVAVSFLLFNLFDSPCLAAISTTAKELNNRKFFWFTIIFQNVSAYCVTLMFYQIVGLCIGEVAFNFWTVVAFVLLAGVLYLLFRKDPNKATAKSTSFAASNV